MVFKIDSVNINIDIDAIVDEVLAIIDESCNNAVCNCFKSLDEVDDFFYDNDEEFNEMENCVRELVTKKMLED